MRFVFLCILVFIGYSFAEEPKGSKEKQNVPLTVTPCGTIRGSWMETRRGRWFEAYRGVRYAESPVGELRFQPPKPILEYKDEVDASSEGPACPLPAPPSYYVDEDCLRLNVYTPNKNVSKPLPVIVFIHPGGFYSMTGRSDLAGPHYLLDRDLILVTINYRLATLGFISTGDKYAPGNNGMKDQVVALRWVQRNIRAFGGDPDSVTIAGVSAGSISVMLHMISPMAKGLFHRAISISGSATTKEPIPSHQRHLAVQQAKILNCPTNTSKDIIDCLKTKPWREFGNSLVQFFEIGYDPVRLWSPVQEIDVGQERYLAEDPALAIQAGHMHAVPHIISQTSHEFYWFAQRTLKNVTLLKCFNDEWEKLAPISLLLPRNNNSAIKVRRLADYYLHGKPLKDDRASAEGLGRLYADSIVGFPVNRMAKLMARHSPKPVYYYQFAYVGQHSFWEDPVTKKPVAAMHHDDMIYLFSLSFRFPLIPLDSADNKLVDRMTAIWYNFARYGDPNPREDTPELGDLKWPPLTNDFDRKYLKIDNSLTVHSNLNEDRYKFWEELYPLWSCVESTTTL